MDIRPILNRELLVATRRKGLWGTRGFFAGMLLTIVLSTFAARYYWDRGKMSDQDIMALVAFQGFLWMLLAHWIVILGVFLGQAAPSIALEKDRRTLDFLLASQLSNAEIVLGKLAACMTMLVAGFASGFPIMLLLHLLGGIDLQLILLGYAGLLTTSFFMISLAIWISTDAPDVRIAASATVLVWMAWLIGPFFVSTIFPRVGLRLPGFLLTVNAWVLTSSPLGLLLKIAGGVRVNKSARGCRRLDVWSASRRRRYSLSSGRSLACARRIASTSVATPRPWPRGSSVRAGAGVPSLRSVTIPILWREMHTSRTGFLGQAVGLVISLGIYGAVTYFTFFFARPALSEVWTNGYSSGITSAEQPEMNMVVRLFMPDAEFNTPADFARTDFNLYLRFVTTPLVFLITLVASGMAAESMTRRAHSRDLGQLARHSALRATSSAATFWQLCGGCAQFWRHCSLSGRSDWPRGRFIPSAMSFRCSSRPPGSG